MTYLIIGNSKTSITEKIAEIVGKLWNKNVSESILFSQHPDIHLVESKNIDSIGIEDIKRIQKEMIFTPYIESVQIALIFNAQKLTTEAQNSFLKTLEESNSSTAYFLITDNEQNLLPTIISRAQKIYTKEISIESKTQNTPKILNLNLIDAFSQIEEIAKEKEKTDALILELELYYQQLLKDALDGNRQTKQICDNIQRVLKTRERLDANGNRRLLLENLFLELTL
jgi:DNA polymerase III delta prime subunit